MRSGERSGTGRTTHCIQTRTQVPVQASAASAAGARRAHAPPQAAAGAQAGAVPALEHRPKQEHGGCGDRAAGLRAQVQRRANHRGVACVCSSARREVARSRWERAFRGGSSKDGG